jgi:D-psicose/D-tagatose/L-ribulose 3-epimerase
MAFSRLAASNIAWEPQDNETVAALLRDAGFGGVEIAPTIRWDAPLDAPPSEVADYRAWWESRRLRIVAMQALLYGRDDLRLFGTDGQRRALLDYLDGMAALGASLGASVLVFGSPKNRQRGEMPIEEALEIAVDFFRQAATAMESRNVRLAIEANPAEYDCDFINTTAEALALVERVNRRGVAVQGDMGAITAAADSAGPTIRKIGSLLAHFHASEPALAETGSGKSDHSAAARALGEIGYQGWISIEMKRAGVASVTRAIRNVRAVYQRVAR